MMWKDIHEEFDLLRGGDILKTIESARHELGEKSQYYAHLVLGNQLLSVERNAVVFLPQREKFYSSLLYREKALPSSLNFLYDSIFIAESSQVASWDGNSIYDLLVIFQNLARQFNLNSLIEIIEYCPTVLQSQRIQDKRFKSAKVGIEWSKFHPYFVDNEGLALVAFCTQNDVQRHQIDDKKIGFCIVAESNVPKLYHEMNRIKSYSHEFEPNLTRADSETILFVDIETNVDEIKGIISPNKVVNTGTVEYGLNATQFQDLIRFHCHANKSISLELGYGSGISIAQLALLFDKCIADKYIEVSEESQNDCFGLSLHQPFESTIAANALMMKKNTKRMSRELIEKKKAIIEGRYIEAYNLKNLLHTYPIALGYFGSVINKEKQDFGDLDVFFLHAISKEAISQDMSRNVYKNTLLHEQKNGRFPISVPATRMYESMSSYSYRVLEKLLQRKDKLISVHHANEVQTFCDEIEVHYVLGERLSDPITSWDELTRVLNLKLSI